MDNESLDTEMGLETLHFPLDAVSSITTDGSLLSGLTTVGIGDDTATTDPNFTDNVMMGNSGLELSDYIPQTCMDASSTLPSLNTDLFQSSSLSHVSPILTTQDPLCGISTPRSQTPVSAHLLGYSEHTNSFNNTSDGVQENIQINSGCLPSTRNQLLSNHVTLNQSHAANSGKNFVTLQSGTNLHTSSHFRQPIMSPMTKNDSVAASSITLRLPLTATINKGVQLRLVTTGQNHLPVSPSIKAPNPNQKTTTNAMLFRDKVTGKHFIVPTGPTNAAVTTKTTNQIVTQLLNQSNHDINSNPNAENSISNTRTPDPASELVAPEFTFDVNDFLNIPPKEQPNSEQDGNTDSVRTAVYSGIGESKSKNQGVNYRITNFPNRIDSDSKYENSSRNFTNTSLHSYHTRSKAPKEQEDKVSSVLMDAISNSNETEAQSNSTSRSNVDFNSAKTGEDLIKMMCMARKNSVPSPPKNHVVSSPPVIPESQQTPKSSDIHEMMPMVIDPIIDRKQHDSSHIDTILDQKSQNKNSQISEGSSADQESAKFGSSIVSTNGTIAESFPDDGIQNGGAIVQTEQRIANLVPDSMKDFVRDIFEDEDALDKECIRHIMDDTTTGIVTPESKMIVVQPIVSPNTSVSLAPTHPTPNSSQIEIKQLTVTQTDYNVHIEDSQCIMVDGNKRWQCNLCPKMYSSKHNLVTHMLGHNGIKPHVCIVCGKAFKQPSHLQTHLLTHGSIKPHTCKICNKSFTQQSHLKRHSAIHLEKKPYLCEICDRGFAYPGELRVHAEKHTNSESNPCNKCGESFNNPKALKLHQNSVHCLKEDLRCKECGKEFVYPSQLRDHMLKHNGKRPFICGECGMDFMKEHHLRSHMFTHTGLRPFQCEICEKSFNQKANLQRHMLIHEENKYKCYLCERTFAQPQVLKSHMATHTGEKAFQCTECGKRFSRRHNLKGHMALHGGAKKYVCFCGAAFTLKGNLNRHKNIKHGTTDGMMADSLLSSMPYDLDADDDIAAEAAAQILNEMSAKRLQQSGASPGDLDMLEGGEFVATGMATTSAFGMDTSRLDMGGEEDSYLNKQDGTMPKKKRKSVPRKTCSKNKAVKTNEKLDSTNDTCDTSVMDANASGINVSTIKRTHVQFNQGTAISKSESDDSNLSPAKPRSARRKKTSVAKASRMNVEVEHDDVEQEWRRLAEGDDVTSDRVISQNQAHAMNGSYDESLDYDVISHNQSNTTNGSHEDENSGHALQDVHSELSSVWRDLRKLKDGFEDPDSCTVNTDAYEMEVDEEGRPKELVTITYPSQDHTQPA